MSLSFLDEKTNEEFVRRVERDRSKIDDEHRELERKQRMARKSTRSARWEKTRIAIVTTIIVLAIREIGPSAFHWAARSLDVLRGQ